MVFGTEKEAQTWSKGSKNLHHPLQDPKIQRTMVVLTAAVACLKSAGYFFQLAEKARKLNPAVTRAVTKIWMGRSPPVEILLDLYRMVSSIMWNGERRGGLWGSFRVCRIWRGCV